MPSPLGHALAGFTIGLLAEPLPASSATPRALVTRFTLLGALLAALPDADLLLPYPHRGWTHSLGASLLVMIITVAVTGWVTRAVAWRLALVLAVAQASHVLLDWMGVDARTPNGIQALWPFNRQYYISGWDFFPPTERNLANPNIVAINLRALAFEAAVLGPVAGLAVWLTRRRRSRGLSSAPSVRPRPSA
jgi:inner membrane protein